MTFDLQANDQTQREREAKAAIDALTQAFLGAFSNIGGRRPDLALIHELFIPQGMIIKSIEGAQETYTVAQFIVPREKLLSDGSLTEFEEEEVAERTDIFGNFAQRLSLYRKRGVLAGQPFVAMGMKSIQFQKTPQGWKMCALIWDDEREGLVVPSKIGA